MSAGPGAPARSPRFARKVALASPPLTAAPGQPTPPVRFRPVSSPPPPTLRSGADPTPSEPRRERAPRCCPLSPAPESRGSAPPGAGAGREGPPRRAARTQLPAARFSCLPPGAQGRGLDSPTPRPPQPSGPRQGSAAPASFRSSKFACFPE